MLFNLSDADFDELAADAEDEHDLNELREETTLVHVPEDEPAPVIWITDRFGTYPDVI